MIYCNSNLYFVKQISLYGVILIDQNANFSHVRGHSFCILLDMTKTFFFRLYLI